MGVLRDVMGCRGCYTVARVRRIQVRLVTALHFSKSCYDCGRSLEFRSPPDVLTPRGGLRQKPPAEQRGERIKSVLPTTGHFALSMEFGRNGLTFSWDGNAATVSSSTFRLWRAPMPPVRQYSTGALSPKEDRITGTLWS